MGRGWLVLIICALSFGIPRTPDCTSFLFHVKDSRGSAGVMGAFGGLLEEVSPREAEFFGLSVLITHETDAERRSELLRQRWRLLSQLVLDDPTTYGRFLPMGEFDFALGMVSRARVDINVFLGNLDLFTELRDFEFAALTHLELMESHTRVLRRLLQEPRAVAFLTSLDNVTFFTDGPVLPTNAADLTAAIPKAKFVRMTRAGLPEDPERTNLPNYHGLREGMTLRYSDGQTTMEHTIESVEDTLAGTEVVVHYTPAEPSDHYLITLNAFYRTARGEERLDPPFLLFDRDRKNRRWERNIAALHGTTTYRMQKNTEVVRVPIGTFPSTRVQTSVTVQGVSMVIHQWWRADHILLKTQIITQGVRGPAIELQSIQYP